MYFTSERNNPKIILWRYSKFIMKIRRSSCSVGILQRWNRTVNFAIWSVSWSLLKLYWWTNGFVYISMTALYFSYIFPRFLRRLIRAVANSTFVDRRPDTRVNAIMLRDSLDREWPVKIPSRANCEICLFPLRPLDYNGANNAQHRLTDLGRIYARSLSAGIILWNA